MLSGINIVCFFASYLVALLLEVSRLWFRSGVRGAVMVLFGAAGLLAHTLFLAHRATTQAVPLSSEYDWYLVAAWLLAATYLYLFWYLPRTAVGLFLLPLVLALIGVAVLWADPQPFAQPKAARFWAWLHGMFLLAGAAQVMVGFVSGLMYLVQARRLKQKHVPLRGLRLPSLEWLERANGRAIVYSMLLLGVGVLSGVILNLVNHRYDGIAVPWTDPLVLMSLLTLAWFLAAAAFSAVYRPARQGRKVAYLTVASFLFLVLLLGVSLFSATRHRGSAEGAAETADLGRRSVTTGILARAGSEWHGPASRRGGR